jgi:hypothetical protein
MGNNSSSDLQRLTPQQQKQIYDDYVAKAKDFNRKLTHMKKQNYKEISDIDNMKKQLRTQINVLHPFNKVILDDDVNININPVNNSNTILNPAECDSNVNGGICNSQLFSPNNLCNLIGQPDGNLVLYNNGKIVWSSNTGGFGVAPFTLIMQDNGNLVWTDANNTVLWSSKTMNKGHGPYKVLVNNSCNLLVKGKDDYTIFNL